MHGCAELLSLQRCPALSLPQGHHRFKAALTTAHEHAQPACNTQQLAYPPATKSYLKTVVLFASCTAASAHAPCPPPWPPSKAAAAQGPRLRLMDSSAPDRLPVCIMNASSDSTWYTSSGWPPSLQAMAKMLVSYLRSSTDRSIRQCFSLHVAWCAHVRRQQTSCSCCGCA
jgi:hypothetical protein